jgi:hypothetical protein
MSRTQPARLLSRRPQHGTVVAYLALFLAVSTGGAWAATKIGAADIKKNAIRTAHIKDGQVRARDLHAAAVTAGKLAANAVSGASVADGSLSGGDIADGTVTGAKVADGSLAGGDIADGAVTTTKLAPNAVTGAKVQDGSLAGGDIDEATLGQVPDAAKLGGRAPSAFIQKAIYKNESAVGPGTTLGDGTSVIAASCNAGDVLLAGGPANVAATSTLLESFPTPAVANSWSARINKNAQTDNFSVVVLCAAAIQ